MESLQPEEEGHGYGATEERLRPEQHVVLLNVGLKCAGFHMARTLDLDKNPVVARLRKAVRERNLSSWRFMHHRAHAIC